MTKQQSHETVSRLGTIWRRTRDRGAEHRSPRIKSFNSMEMSDIVRELKAIYKDGIPYRDLDRHLTESDVQRWNTMCGGPRSQLFDAIAGRLARGFNASELSFEFCDAVVNDLSVAVTNTSGPKPQLFWEVYSAFDEGEYYHDGNREEDPVNLYTRPMIAQICRRHS